MEATNVHASTLVERARITRSVEATVGGYTYTLARSIRTTEAGEDGLVAIRLTQRVFVRHSWQERRVPHGRRRGELLNLLMPLLPGRS